MDYALYGLAVILFALAAITYALVADDSFKFLYVGSTAIVGILALVGGYFLRPKTAAIETPAKPEPEQPQVVPPEVPAVQPAQPVGGAIVEAPTTQMQVAEAPKVEVPAVQAPPAIPASMPAPVPAAATAESEFSQIRGINQSRASQLKTVGINSVADLAKASPEELAAKLNVSPKIVKMWIGSAKKLTK